MHRPPTALQLNILRFLRENGGWCALTLITEHQISEKGAVYKATHRLIEHGLVEKRESNLSPLYRAVPQENLP